MSKKGRRYRNEKHKTLYLTFGCVAVCCVLAVPLWLGSRTASNQEAQEAATPPAVVQQVVEKTGLAAIYYYEEDKAERYTAYQASHPDLSDGDVVWQVNAMLDQPFYDAALPAEMDGTPLIVNKYRYLAADYVPEDMVKLPSGKLATRDTYEAYTAMDTDAKALGYKLYATSAYRSYDYQNTLYNKYLGQENGDVATVDTYSARPGYSEHQTGMAIDLIGSFGSLNDFINTPEGPWIKENCYKYGFIIRYQEDNVAYTGYKYEPWHIRYVGVEIATAMHDLGINTLEEYVVKYIDHQPPAADTAVSTDGSHGSPSAL